MGYRWFSTSMIRIDKIHFKISQYLKTAIICTARPRALTDKIFIDHRLRDIVLAFQNKFPDFFKTIMRLVIIGILGSSRPECDIIQDNIFRENTAVWHHAQSAITEGKGLLPPLGGSVMPYLKFSLSEAAMEDLSDKKW